MQLQFLIIVIIQTFPDFHTWKTG